MRRMLGATLAALALGALAACGDDDEGAAPGTRASTQPTTAERAKEAPKRSGEPVTELQSRPDLRPPEVVVDRSDGVRDDGLVFLSPRAGEDVEAVPGHQQGALIADQEGRVVWFAPAPGGEPVTDVRVQEYQGEPVLTFWRGAASKFGIGRGEGVLLDRSYREIATVQAGDGHTVDLHEIRLTPRGTALVTIYSRARRDLTALGGREDAQVTQGIVQEIDVASGEVLFEWKSLDHVDPEESVMPLPEDPEGSFDYFHINSIDEAEDGDLLVSARNTSTVYAIDRDTGDVRWRLGGKKSDFPLDEQADIGWQHDARWVGPGQVQIFDNAAEVEEDERQTASSVKTFAVDPAAGTARLLQRFEQPERLWAQSQGNAQRLDGGGAFVGWGSLGRFSRFDGTGRLLLSGHIPEGYDSYRAYLQRWDAQAPGRPRVAATAEGGGLSVYVSWNGATEVAEWQVLAGDGPDSLEPMGEPAPWDGLETTIELPSPAPYVAVRALDADGAPLATSAAVRPD